MGQLARNSVPAAWPVTTPGEEIACLKNPRIPSAHPSHHPPILPSSSARSRTRSAPYWLPYHLFGVLLAPIRCEAPPVSVQFCSCTSTPAFGVVSRNLCTYGSLAVRCVPQAILRPIFLLVQYFPSGTRLDGRVQSFLLSLLLHRVAYPASTPTIVSSNQTSSIVNTVSVMLIEGEKWACDACVRGHRVSNCQHNGKRSHY